MRCPKCNGPLPIGKEVCKSCHYNYRTLQYDIPAPQKPVEKRCPMCGNVIADGEEVCRGCRYNYVKKTYEIPEPPKPVENRCPMCGSIVPNAEAVCRNCHYNYKTRQYEHPEPPKPVPPKPSPVWNFFKKTIAVVLTVLFASTAGYIGKQVGRSGIPAVIDQVTAFVDRAVDAVLPDTEKHNPAFEEIFTGRGITYAPQTSMRRSESFAKVGTDGIIEVLEFGHSGDKVKEYIDTIWIPTDRYGSAEIQILRSEIESIAAQVFGTVTRANTEGNYYVIGLTVKNVDDKQVMEAMSRIGAVSVGSDGQLNGISLKETRNSLLANGYIQR